MGKVEELSASVEPQAPPSNENPVQVIIEIKESTGDLNLDVGTDMAILKIRDGFFKSLNDSNPTKAITPFDRIISVNDATSAEEMRAQLQKPGNMVAIVRKSREFKLVLEKRGAPLGLDIAHSGGNSLQVRGVKVGVV